jgi:hypothetical protein
MRCALAGPTKVTPGHSRGDQGRPDRIAFRAQALAFLDRGSGERPRRNNVAHDARCIEHFTRARETVGGGIDHNAFAGSSSGGGQVLPGWNRPGNVAAIGADLA